jgi:phage tail sheath protein FI
MESMPPTFSYPGVYIEELSSGVHTITGVATSIAAFVGWAPQGPTTQATLVQSWPDFASKFGGLDSRSYLGYAVNQFFANGGQQAYIVRLIQSTVNTVGPATSKSGSVTIPATGGTLVFTAKTPGAWPNSYGIQIAAGTAAGSFKIMFVYAPAGTPLAVLETFDNLNVSPAPTITSNFVTLAITGTLTANPATGFYSLAGGDDGNGVNVAAAAESSVTVFQPASTTAGFKFTATNPGAWGNLLAINATPQSAAMDPTGTRFSLNIMAIAINGALTVVESYNNLSVTASDPRYVLTVLNSDSNYVSVAVVGTPTQALNQAQPSSVSTSQATPLAGALLAGGTDGIILDPTSSATAAAFNTALNADGTGSGGVHLLDTVSIFNLLCVPGETDPTTIQNLQGYCHDERAFYIVDSPQDIKLSSLMTNGPGNITGVNAINSAFYFPWVNAPDPLQQGRIRAFPPCGFVTGLYAATDTSRGVWKAPAGIDASLTGESGLATVLTDAQNGTLNVQAINCLRNFPVYGDVVWGARTLRGNDQVGSEWKYVPIRRLALYLESSLYDGTQWVVFEPNDEKLWGQIRLNVGAFMQGLFLQGAFQGTTPQQAYFVKCDGENNPQASIDQGIVNVLVGFAPLYPAEFVVIQIQQMAGQLQS